MKTYNHYLWFDTKDMYEIVNITPHVEDAVEKSGVREGL
jgi:thiamine phosphate synthase YjbQ (UPF0047 family)